MVAVEHSLREWEYNMGSPNLVPIPAPDDKLGIIRCLRKLASLRLNADSHPTFAGLTITGEMSIEGLVTDYVDFNLTPSVSAQEGRAYWNTDDGTLNIGMPGGNVNLQVGQEILIRCRNTTGSLIVNGAAIRISGASGGKALIELADASDVNTGVTGLATEDIANNSNGYINIKGMVRDFDTSSFAPGTHLFLNSGGGLTNVPPTGNKRKAFVGTVIVQGSENGSVLIQPQNSPFLSGLSGVDIVSIQDGQVLSYDGATSSWKNTSPSTGVTTFSLLTDTPASMSGESLKAVRVNVGETALEYYTPSGGGVTDHGALTGLTDDDHVGYLLIDGTRAMTGDLDMDENHVTNTGDVYPVTDDTYDLGIKYTSPGTLELSQENHGGLAEAITSSQWRGNTFTTVTGFNLEKIVLLLQRTTGGTQSIRVSVWETIGGLPTGSPLETKDLIGMTLLEDPDSSLIDVVFDTIIPLSATTMYAFSVEELEGNVRLVGSGSDEYAGGTHIWTNDSGSAWGVMASWEHVFYLYSEESEQTLAYHDLFLKGDLSDGTNSISVAEIVAASGALLIDGSNAMTADLDVGANNIVQAGDIVPDDDDLYDLGEVYMIPGGGFELQEESTTESTEYAITNSQWGMQTFTPTEDYTIGRVVFKLRENQAGEILLTVGIYATSGGKPTGSALVEKVVDLDGHGNALAEATIDFDTPYALTNGVQYAIVLTTPGGGIWGAYGTPSTSPGGNWGVSYNQGSSWTINTGWDWYFQVYAAISSTEYVRWNDLYLAGSLKDGTVEVTIADIYNSLTSSVRTETADYEMVAGDVTVLVDTTSGAVTLTLPATPSQAQTAIVKCIDATNTCTVARNGNNIDGAASDQTLTLNESLTLQYDSTFGWAII
jgi:hypothetical protein